MYLLFILLLFSNVPLFISFFILSHHLSSYGICLELNVFTASKGANFYILFAITAAGVVPCGGTKKYRTFVHSVDYISFGPLRSVRIFRVLKLNFKSQF